MRRLSMFIVVVFLFGQAIAQDYVKVKVLSRPMQCEILEVSDSLIVFQKANSTQILKFQLSDVDWYLYSDGSGQNFTNKPIDYDELDKAFAQDSSKVKKTPPPVEIEPKEEPTRSLLPPEPGGQRSIEDNPDRDVSVEINMGKQFLNYKREIPVLDSLLTQESPTGATYVRFRLTIPAAHNLSFIFGGGYLADKIEFEDDQGSWSFKDTNSGFYVDLGVKIFFHRH